MQRNMTRWTLARALASLMLGIMVSGCAGTLLGAKDAPPSWLAPSFSCTDLAGTYSVQGEAAPANAHAGMFNVVWPNAGSLTAMIETGANGIDRREVAAVLLTLDAGGQPTFAAFDSGGKPQSLVEREWQCLEGRIETRALLSGSTLAHDSDPVDESVIRLWKAPDGALIAENTVESAKWSSSGPSTRRRPLARFFFRFAPVAPVVAKQ